VKRTKSRWRISRLGRPWKSRCLNGPAKKWMSRARPNNSGSGWCSTASRYVVILMDILTLNAATDLRRQSHLIIVLCKYYVWQQFNRFELHDGRICERDFAESLVVYAGYNSKRRVRMLKRVKKAFKDTAIVSYSSCCHSHYYHVYISYRNCWYISIHVVLYITCCHWAAWTAGIYQVSLSLCTVIMIQPALLSAMLLAGAQLIK